jgi:hypothetical protein
MEWSMTAQSLSYATDSHGRVNSLFESYKMEKSKGLCIKSPEGELLRD